MTSDKTIPDPSFEAQVKMLAEKAILKFFTDGNWIQADLASRVKTPQEFMAQVWAKVDFDKIKTQLADRLEKELADRIVNSMAAELATDVKQILSVPERREALRAVCRENFDRICGKGAT